MQLTLYHGTNSVAARQILRDSVYKTRYKDIHYLGQGIYFYDNDASAEKWIKIFYSGNGVILENEILVDDEDVFDMRKRTYREKAIEIVKEIRDKNILTKASYDDSEYYNKRRCFLYDIISKESNCKLLISIVFTHQGLWELGYPQKGDLQFCVKDPSIVKQISFFRNVGVGIV